MLMKWKADILELHLVEDLLDRNEGGNLNLGRWRVGREVALSRGMG
jgi:hypothetical protein